MRDQRRHRGARRLVVDARAARRDLRQPAPLPRAAPGLGGGIASNILSSRLKRLVAAGLLTREEATRGQRAAYSLTEAGIQICRSWSRWAIGASAPRRHPRAAGACRAAPRRWSRASLKRLVKRHGAARVTGSWRPSSTAAGGTGGRRGRHRATRSTARPRARACRAPRPRGPTCAGTRYHAAAGRRLIPPPSAGDDPEPLASLTEREVQVLPLIGRGRTNSDIAAELYVSEATVKTHVNRLFAS